MGSDGARYKRVDGGKTTLYLGNVEIEDIGGAKTYKRTVAGIMLRTGDEFDRDGGELLPVPRSLGQFDPHHQRQWCCG